MPSPVYQDMVNLIVGVPIWRCPSIFMNVAMREHCIFTLTLETTRESIKILAKESWL
jgi:hypothetical protein